MADDLDTAVEKSIFSTHNLVAALLVVAGVTFGIFTWDAERALNKLDEVDASSTKTASHVEVLVNQIDTIANVQDRQSTTLLDHEKRITTLEADNALAPHRR